MGVQIWEFLCKYRKWFEMSVKIPEVVCTECIDQTLLCFSKVGEITLHANHVKEVAPLCGFVVGTSAMKRKAP